MGAYLAEPIKTKESEQGSGKTMHYSACSM